MTAKDLRNEAYLARARKSIDLIEDEADWSATAFIWVHSTQAKKKPKWVQDAILAAMEAKSVEIANLARFG